MRYILTLFATFFLITQFLTAQNLQLDPSFHHDGFVVTDFGHGPDSVASIAQLPDGKFLVGSTSWNGTTDIAVSRYHADGSLDPSFGSRGRVFISSSANDHLVSLFVLPDEKILLAGTLDNYGTLVRLLPGGDIDNTFGNNGRVTAFAEEPFGNFATAAAVQPDGKILITTVYSKNSPFGVLVRYSSEGFRDTLFGSGGYVGTGSVERVRAIGIQPGGKIILAGNVLYDYYAFGDVLLERLTPEGQRDSSFGTNGFVEANLYDSNEPKPSRDRVSAMLIQPDSTILVIGHAYRYGDPKKGQRIALARFSPNGLLQGVSSSTPGGIGGPPHEAFEEGLAGALQPDGKIVVAGSHYEKNLDNIWQPSFFILRYLPDGSLDDDFYGDGRRIIDVGQYDRAQAVAVLPGGEILAAGQVRRAYPYFENEDVDLESDIATVRLDSTGALDTLFATGGIARVAAGTNTDRATDLILQQDGKIVIGAVLDSVMPYREPAKPAIAYNYEVQNAPYFAISRYLEDGTLDTTFGTNGRTGFLERELGYYGSWWLKYSNVFNDPNAPPLKAAIATRPNGNILLAGVRYQDFGVAEFYSNGAQDTSLIFGAPGVPIPQPPYVLGIDFNHYYEVATAIVADDVLNPIPGLNGFTTAGYSGDETAVAWCCYLGIGAPGINRATVNIGPDKDYATAVGYQIDTALSREYTLVGGYYLDGPGKRHRSFLYRLINNIFSYDIDNTFGDAGIIRYKIGTISDQINAFVVQADNSIVAAGAVDNKMAVFRFLPDGSFDNSFGNKGAVIITAGLAAGEVAVQPNGKIVATGYTADKIVTARLLPNGQPDPAFGYNGVLVTSLRGKKDRGNAVAVQPDGKIVVAGASDDPYAGTDITVLRYKPNSGIPPLGASAAVVGVSCPDNSDGQAAVTATGGFPPYTYKWNTGETTFSLSGLSAAAYTVTVTDSVQVKFVLTVDVPIAPDTSAPSITCPLNIITQACSTAVQYDLPVATDNCGADVPHLVSGLPPGSVFAEGATVVVYQTADAAGNTAICQFEIRVENTLLLTTDADPACPGELNLLTASAAGGTPPYAYIWSSGNTGPLVLTAISGLFTVTLTDALGCARSDTVSVQSLPPMDIAGTITPAWIDSANGAITVTVGGGVPPFTYAWYQAGQQVGAGPALSNIPGGDYTLVVTDAAGCMNTTLWTVPEVVATTEPANVLQCRVFPNPFTETLHLQLELRHSAEVRWRICDLSGRCYDEHVAGHTGYLQAELRTGDLPAGMYLLYIRVGKDNLQQKLVKVVLE